ncbi:hypothetical protein LINGRAHAP2_LOCUS8497, partial [Linum grandiflorum]
RRCDCQPLSFLPPKTHSRGSWDKFYTGWLNIILNLPRAIYYLILQLYLVGLSRSTAWLTWPHRIQYHLDVSP